MAGFYVYAHYDANGAVRYVGKGSGNRAWKMHHRNKFWAAAFPDRQPCRVELLERDVADEQTAYDLERQWIERLKAEGHPLANMPPAKYWQGKKRDPALIARMTAASHTPEMRARHSEKMRGRTVPAEVRSKMGRRGEAHHNYGKKFSPELRAKLSAAHKGQGVGRKLSEAHKEKIRMAALARFAGKVG